MCLTISPSMNENQRTTAFTGLAGDAGRSTSTNIGQHHRESPSARLGVHPERLVAMTAAVYRPPSPRWFWQTVVVPLRIVGAKFLLDSVCRNQGRHVSPNNLKLTTAAVPVQGDVICVFVTRHLSPRKNVEPRNAPDKPVMPGVRHQPARVLFLRRMDNSSLAFRTPHFQPRILHIRFHNKYQ